MLVAITIIIPIILLGLDIKLDIFIVPLFLIFYALFAFLNTNVHKFYLKNEDIKDEGKNNFQNKKKIFAHIFVLVVTGVLLYIVGNLLGDSLENLCKLFNVPEFILGVFLGFITSVPELITFFESQTDHKKSKDGMVGVIEATNNLFTSNVMNLFVIQTIGILINS